MIGAPIQRNRAWIIQDYLNHIYQLDYPKDDIHIAFFLNGTPKDCTGEYVFEFKSKFGDQYARCDIWAMDDDNDDGNRSKRNYNHFAKIRNIWLSMRRKTDDYIFSVDSDILVPKDSLKTLLSNDLDIVAAPIINFSCPVGQQYNFLFKTNGSNAKPNEPTYSSGTEMPDNIIEVDATGACMLLNRDVLTAGAYYGYHYQGEDIFFCDKAQNLGYKIYVDPNTKPKHYREREDYENSCKML
jgi:cellulose synthase/poly-beta-1,6-N-acetylglucosamine synthase-like glycosyltransferase